VSALTSIVPDEAFTRSLDAGLFGNLLAALGAPNAAVVARATASDSAANLLIRAFIEIFSRCVRWRVAHVRLRDVALSTS
jgi:hypothetical protein